MENQENFNELEEVRQQLEALKNKVDRQGRLNEDLIRKSIQGKMRGIHRTLFKMSVISLLAIPLWIWIKFDAGLSWGVVIMGIIVMVGSLISDFVINRMDVYHMGDDMLETANRLAVMKKRRSIGQKIGIGVAVIWLIWLGYEFFSRNLADFGPEVAWISLSSIFIGAVIGGAIGLQIYHKMQRTNDEMIDQIHKFIDEQKNG